MMSLSENQIELIEERLKQIEEWSYEYNSEHEDIGASYVFLIRESHSPERDKQIADYCQERLGATDEECKRIREEWYDRCDDLIDIRSGHIFSNRQPLDGINLDAFPVGEIEEQIELADINAYLADHEEEEISSREFYHWQESQREFCLRMWQEDKDYFYMYINTDAVWFFDLSDETLRDMLADIREEMIESQEV